MDLTQIDIQILGLLQSDASLTAAQIGERVNLSASPCWRRINRLEEAGLIEKKVALLDPDKLGLGLVVLRAFACRKTTRPRWSFSRNRCVVLPRWSSATR